MSHIKSINGNFNAGDAKFCILAARFNARSIPMLVLLKDGVEVETVVGAQPKASLERLVERHS